MANMSYCRFENTSSDLGDCVWALDEYELDELSERERRYAKKMYDLCREYIEKYEEKAECEV